MAGFDQHGCVCIASCHHTECDYVRQLSLVKGHAFAVCFIPGDNNKFRMQWAANIVKLAENAAKILVISSSNEELGNMQQEELAYLRSHHLGYEVITRKVYESSFQGRNATGLRDEGLGAGLFISQLNGDFMEVARGCMKIFNTETSKVVGENKVTGQSFKHPAPWGETTCVWDGNRWNHFSGDHTVAWEKMGGLSSSIYQNDLNKDLMVDDGAELRFYCFKTGHATKSCKHSETMCWGGKTVKMWFDKGLWKEDGGKGVWRLLRPACGLS